MKKTSTLIVATASVLLLTACGAAGPSAPTRTIKQVTDGVEATSGSIYIRDLLLVAQPDGSAALVATFVNEGATPDALTGITVNGQATTLSAPSFPLLQNKPVIFSGQSANATGSVANLSVALGSHVPVVVSFSNAPSVTLTAVLHGKSGQYASVGSAKLATAASPTPSATK